MKTSIPEKDVIPGTDPYHGPSQHSESKSRASYEASDPRYELGLWLQAVRSFFHARNHPFSDAEQLTFQTRDWTNELVIARQTLLHVAQLTFRMVHLEDSSEFELDKSSADQPEKDVAVDISKIEVSRNSRRSFVDLAEVLGDVCSICESLLQVPKVAFLAWATVGRILSRELDRSEIAVTVEREAYHIAALKLPPRLLDEAQAVSVANDVNSDIQAIIFDQARLLERLRIVEGCLKRDQPLKQTLPIFCLVNEEARLLLEFIDGRLHRAEHFERPVFDALDGMNYAIAMELRKVYARELVGLAALRQSPSIYARVENSHGLLRDCFQQSIVAVAQLIEPTIDVSRLFDNFQTRLEQSLILRRDLWELLQIVRLAERERDKHPISRLLDRLAAFRDGSLRYLMYKDWEACERFMEEVAAARGAVEVTPVLHRFGAYLETLFGQVNMRNVLLDHVFDYPAGENSPMQ